MNIFEFCETYKNYSQKDRVQIGCSCGKINNVQKEKVVINITRHGEYLCRSCSMKRSHENNPITEETKNKQRLGRLGKKHNLETKRKLSNIKKEFFQTERGLIVRKKLAIKACKEQAEGKIRHSHIKGYFPSAKSGNTFYASSYELRCQVLLEQDVNVKSYASQVPIEINGRSRCVDLMVLFNDDRPKLVIEVKPKKRLNENNVKLQISDLQQYAQVNGYDFQICTEDNSGLESEKAIFLWACDYVLNELKGIDLKEIKKEKSRIRQVIYRKKHYDDLRTTFWCEYCKEEHTVRKWQYNKNVEKNGRYICMKENGTLIGSRPKKRKENPYAAEGKKQCNKCKKIKLFADYNLDKTRGDGYSNICRECNRRACMERYRRD